MRTTILAVLFASITLLLGCQSNRSSSDRISGIYSNLHYIEEAGDLFGMELYIVPSGSGSDHTAFVQISEGGLPYTALAPITLRGSKLEFTLPASPQYPSARFTGNWNGSCIVLRWENGEAETLKRGRSYWE